MGRQFSSELTSAGRCFARSRNLIAFKGSGAKSYEGGAANVEFCVHRFLEFLSGALAGQTSD
jgi:hypothetical protein